MPMTKQCVYCDVTKTPQWRKTNVGMLCNRCGIRHLRSLRKEISKSTRRAATSNAALVMCAETLMCMVHGI